MSKAKKPRKTAPKTPSVKPEKATVSDHDHDHADRTEVYRILPDGTVKQEHHEHHEGS